MSQQGPSHPAHAIILSVVNFLHKGAFYGIRTFIVLFMASDTIGLSTAEILTLFGWFSGAVLLSHFLGGLLGDLVLGNRNAAIIGGGFQALGAFVLCT